MPNISLCLYICTEKDVRNHRIITFSQIVAIISVTVESSPILIPRKFYHSLLDFFGFCSADRERVVIGKDNIIAFYRKMKRVFTMNDLCMRINP